MKIDVIVCAKNEAKTLDNALKQISSKIQLKDLIVVYGISKDDTKEIALRHTDKVFWDKDKGLGAARNLGMRKATTKIVAMIDPDVILPKEWDKKLIHHFADPQVAAAMGTCIYGYGCSPLQKFWEYETTIAQEQWGTNNVLFRRRIVLEKGNFNEDIKGAGEDYELYSRLVKAGYKWIWDKSVIVYHPMTLLECIRHNVWWAKGVSSIRDDERLSLLGFLRSIVYGFKKGIRYFRVHPILSFYIPLINAIWAIAEFSNRKHVQ